jgi:hypothetical protein
VPLSNEELRMLEQMERALTQDDPHFAAALGGTRERRRYERDAILGAIAFLLGLATMVAAATFQLTVLGVVGFVFMVCAASAVASAMRVRSLLR